jgi:hypothetical protein
MTDWHAHVPRDAHWLIVGGTRRGKSGLLQLITRAFLASQTDGITVLDPHGAFARALVEWMANPAHEQQRRRVHLLDPGGDHFFGLNPLRVDDPASWTQCHDAANTLASVIESRFEATAEQTPRLSRIVYVAGMLCARRGLTLIEMLEVLSLGGEQLRQTLLTDFDNAVVRHELEDLHQLADRQPARFLETVESAKNRLVRWLGDRRLARILGQPRGLNPRAVMDGRDVVIFDGSSLSYADAAFVGTILSSMYFTSARYRPPLRSATHRLIIDEAESLLTADVARLCDQTAKMGLVLIAAIQRLGQLRARGDFIADAMLVNCGVKVAFGGLDSDSARYMAENLHGGYLDLAEWKPGTERPTAVGQRREVVRSRTRAVHAAEHESESMGIARSVGHSRSRMHATTSASSEGWAEGVSQAASVGTSSGESSATTASSFDAASLTETLATSTVDALFTPATIIGIAQGASAGSGVAESAGYSSASSSMDTAGTSSLRSGARMYAETEAVGESDSVSQTESYARSRGTSRGTSHADGESETFVTDYAPLPQSTYSLEEQLHRAAAALMNLPRRACVVKIEGEAPQRVRTADLTPAFRSGFFQRLMLPRFVETTIARSRYALSAAAADAAVVRRSADLRCGSADADFSPEAMPIVDDPDAFAARFWAKRGKPALRIVKTDGDKAE